MCAESMKKHFTGKGHLPLALDGTRGTHLERLLTNVLDFLNLENILPLQFYGK